MSQLHRFDFVALETEAKRLGFMGVSVARFDSLPDAKQRLDAWLAESMHGTMEYMEKNASLRLDPTLLLPNARSALLFRLNYLHQPTVQLQQSRQILGQPLTAQISLYAQGRDYHTVIRNKLKHLVRWLQANTVDAQFRIFTDSAPVMEVQLAQDSGLGWRGKHTLLLNREGGSTFFLGGILTTLDLPETVFTPPVTSHCGQCVSCIEVCPTQAIVAPYVVDARRCISYLTIEHDGSIPVEFRSLIGNRVYGCDDCQTACPWNKFAQSTGVADFKPRHHFDTIELLQLWSWTEEEFLERLQGSAIRRIGYARWLRNLATAMGNALASNLTAHDAMQVRQALQQRRTYNSAMVREHIEWALLQ
jgi:epoxyqueuosine reductase